MSITFQESGRMLILSTAHTSYVLEVPEDCPIRHLYYGPRISEDSLGYLFPTMDISFSPNPHDFRETRTISADVQPQEYSSINTGDFRIPALEVLTEDGVFGVDLRYVTHTISPGKYTLSGLPCSDGTIGEAETLTLTLADARTGLTVELLYGVYADEDVLTRSVRILNKGQVTAELRKVSSMTLDIPYGTWDLIHFHGRHAMERQMERFSLPHGRTCISSLRGASSHHHNPFVILADSAATETAGEALAILPVYSGNHQTEIELDQMGLVRIVSGIAPDQFSWELAPGAIFEAPEIILSYTASSLEHLSHTLHLFLSRHLLPAAWRNRPRPVLINNWEATYFSFTSEKILALAREARELGLDMVVLDDGWFGQRNSDNAGLGDWAVNEAKLPGGFADLIPGIEALGLSFGLWIEPEMVNEDSDLYRAHPDWALTVPGRSPTMGRNQLVLDMTNPEVREYLYNTFSTLLRRYSIRYIKWDMNRNITDVYSKTLPAHRQGEVCHRYILGVYELLERLTREFPDVLWEGCAGGGGRFDAGMLHYFPQIWLSDDTDAIERLDIQYGSSFAYPLSTISAHVSACPNHQTGRTVPLGTRTVVAMTGAFGYELDPATLSAEEKAQIRDHVQRYRSYRELIQTGLYYRLAHAGQNGWFTAWSSVSQDQSEALVSVVITRTRPNYTGVHFRLRGLDPSARYRLDAVHLEGVRGIVDSGHMETTGFDQVHFTGSTLLYAGYTLPQLGGDYPGVQLHFVREQN